MGEIVGADLAAAVAAAYLTFPLLGNGGILPFLLGLVQPGTQDLHRPLPVFMLAAFVLTLYHRTGGQVCDADGGFRLVNVLPAGTGGTVGVDLQILGIDGKLHLLRLRHHCHGSGGGLDTTGGLCLRHPLYPMSTSLKLQTGESSGTLHGGHGFLYAAQLRFVDGYHIQREALPLGVHGVHPQQVSGKQRAFLAADAGPDLQHDVFLIVGVFRQQQAL